jgi:hypothetical protein
VLQTLEVEQLSASAYWIVGGSWRTDHVAPPFDDLNSIAPLEFEPTTLHAVELVHEIPEGERFVIDDFSRMTTTEDPMIRTISGVGVEYDGGAKYTPVAKHVEGATHESP